jgi:hypothetical protein
MVTLMIFGEKYKSYSSSYSFSSLLLLPSSYIKSKVHPITGHEGPEGEVEPYSFLNLSARWGWLINAMPWPFYP